MLEIWGNNTKIFNNYSTPSTSGKGKLSSWNLVSRYSKVFKIKY